jgi:UDP-N-acetylglucosamine transferase subunit ALG13
MKTEKKIKIALISTIGGHFEQLLNLEKFYSQYPHFWITNKNKQTESALQNETKFFISAAHFSRPWEYLFHIPKVFWIFLIQKPTHIVSTGSGRTALIPYFLSKIMNIKFILVETYSRVNNLTLFAKLLVKQKQKILTQWEHKNPYTIYIGPIFTNDDLQKKENPKKEEYIFVTLGTRGEQFPRIIDYVDELSKKGIIKEKVIIQIGHTIPNKIESKNIEIFKFCTAEEINELINNSKYVITQESAGIVTKCLKFKQKFLVLPRDYKYNELPSQSDMEEDLHLKMEKLGYTKVIKNVDELETAIKDIEDLKTGFVFDNTLAISKLNELVVKK